MNKAELVAAVAEKAESEASQTILHVFCVKV